MKKSTKPTPTRSFSKRVGDKKGLITVGIIAVLIAIFFIVQAFQGSAIGTETEQFYSIYTVREEDPVLFDGIVQASEVQEEYYDASNGVIGELLVENGQEVEEGTDLFTYTNEENQQLLNEQNRQYSRLEKRRSEAETELANARKASETADANITKSNRTIESAGQSQLDQVDEESEQFTVNTELDTAQNDLLRYESDKAEADATVDSAQMSIRDLNEQMEDIEFEIERLRGDITTTVQANFDGIIELNQPNISSIQASEEPVIRLMSKEQKIDASVSEYDYDKITLEDTVEISLITSDRVLGGTVTKLSTLPMQASSEGGSSSSRYPFTVIPEESIQYGFSVQIGVDEGIVYLPQSVVIEEEEGTIVFVHNEGIVERREVQVTEDGSLYILESGLEMDEEVIMDPDMELADGDEVGVFYD
ncbi:efflux RND transporter periplasmic adaptor subunit [Marinilactibacillus sp. Marseille-P9653]|uniref:efflux RND transporter periplasmic adaptor subunit n=1 Tax=Marinilactibacillus sp. Marseille-P9653 TaxID=2866583 RepID=UPI001CE4993F|nr:efflux RND transporter periplasmic adaptor subunit [Marinilactibacillus sp. Marseille-P9653]